MTRLLLVYAVAALPALAWGQEVAPERFVPFAPGDRWDYHVEVTTQSETSNGGAPTTTEILKVLRVERDTLVDGETWTLYDHDDYALDGSLQVERSQCVGRYVQIPRGDREITVFEVSADSPSGCPLELASYAFAQREDAPTIMIGDDPFEAEATEEWVDYGSGVGGSSFEKRALHAADIGLVHYESTRARTLSPTSSSTETLRLLYARVGGESYGTQAVSSDAPPRAATALTAAAFPNPGTGQVRLHVEGAADALLSAEVFDTTGRLVWSGALRLGSGVATIPPTAWVPGVYAVRLQDAGGRTTVVRVARL